MEVVTPRDSQSRAVAEVRARMASGARRVLLQSMMGSGKSVMAAMMLSSAVARGRRCAFLVHRRGLVEQFCGHLRKWGVPHGVVMSGERLNPAAPVQVASRDTLLSRCVRNKYHGVPPADLVVIDEAHNVPAPEYSALLRMYPSAWLVGLSATPARNDGTSLADEFDALVCAVPTSQLVREGHLVPVRCYAPEREGHRRGKTGLAGDPVSHWKRLAEGRPTVLFTGRVKTSESLVAEFNDQGIPAAHIDAHTPKERRDEVAAMLADGSLKVASNVGIWTEGTDIPQLACAILYRMAGSCVLYLQAVGRIMRPWPGKTEALLLDHSGAVFKHGFPDEDFPWSLEGASTVDERKRKERKEAPAKKPLCCPACGLMFQGALACPHCGHFLPKRLLPAAVKHELLIEARKKATPEELYMQKCSYWRKCLAVMAARGMTLGAAGAMYKSMWGDFPGPELPDVPPRGPCWARPVVKVFPHLLRRRPVA
jgi:DNA repair protein RadD